MVEMVEGKRRELLEALANVDDEMAEFYLNEEIPSKESLKVRIYEEYRISISYLILCLFSYLFTYLPLN